MRNLFTLLLLGCLPLARAVFKDEAGEIDWHYPLLGLPQQETTVFHRPRRDDKATLLYTLSDLGILGAVNPGSGQMLWRQPLTANHTLANGGGHLRAPEGEGWVASAFGSSVSAWDAIGGRNIWTLDFQGKVRDLEVMELTVDGRKDLLALFYDEAEGVTTMRRIQGTEGSVVWEYREVGKDLPLQVSNNVEKVFVVNLHGSPGSYSLKVSTLETKSGRKIDEVTLSAKGDVLNEKDVMFVGANSATPIVAWTDSAFTTLKVNVLGTKGKQEFPLVPGTVSVDIHAPRLVQSDPHFLVHMRTATANAADVFHVNLKSNAITKAYDLPLQAGKGAVSTGSSDANVYFTRITQGEMLLVQSTSHDALARWPLKTGQDVGQVDMVHAVSEVVKKPDGGYAVRAAAVTDADDWVLLRNGEVAWTRPEGLSGAVAAAWAEIPESEELAFTLSIEAHINPLQAYIHRVKRHVNDLQHLPGYLQALPQRLLGSILGTNVGAKEGAKLSRDSFGFSKIVVLATRRGRLYGLNAGDKGKILWNTKAFDIPVGEAWDVKGMLVNDGEGHISALSGRAEYVTVSVLGSRAEYITVKADDGKLLDKKPPGQEPPVQSAAVVDSESGRYLLSIGEGGRVGKIGAEWAPKQTPVVVEGPPGTLRGLAFVPAPAPFEDIKLVTEETLWTFKPPPGQEIVHVAKRPRHDPVASIGRVLGDRRVMYKYLNPNTIVASAIDRAAATLTTYLLDTVSGEILSSATYEGVDPSKGAECVLSENFFVCTFFGEYSLRDSPAQSIRGYLVTVTDLYESEEPNDRGPLGAAANFSSLGPLDDPTAASAAAALPHVVSQTFVLGGGAPISSLAVTSTRQGISSRQVLAYLPEERGIAAFHRAVLEPRRPVGRDPTAQELEEGLMRYAPGIEVDPKSVLTHEREVLGVVGIMAGPAAVESTSLVLAYGVDVYGTRVAPSFVFDILGKGFNKVSLIGTVAGLTAGVAALAPLVRKKQINLRWSMPA